LIAGYVVIVSFFIIQWFLRKTPGAKSFKGGTHDKGNMVIIGSATGIGLWIPIILDVVDYGIFQLLLIEGLIALAIMLCGFGLRIWAALTLGKYYTTTLMITDNQKVISSGPYSRIRHPGYLAEMLLWSAFGVLSGDLIAMIILPTMFVAAYLYRISSEEKMLVSELGDIYRQYQRRTHKLIPFLY
jgi:protein-S-isoprenylcysteine O-methyltransferase Ste14